MQKLIEVITGLLALFFRPQKTEQVAQTKPTPEVTVPEWISLAVFQAATGLSEKMSRDWYGHVRAACWEFGIVGPVRIAAFLAQVGHESGGFVWTRELWGPTTAQKRYEGRADLGNTQPGDGFRFRGRGLIQITGRDNYQRAAAGLGVDVVVDPQLLEERALAARSAAWWWKTHGCNQLADGGDFVALTRRINGGTNGLTDRQTRWERAKKAIAGAA